MFINLFFKSRAHLYLQLQGKKIPGLQGCLVSNNSLANIDKNQCNIQISIAVKCEYIVVLQHCDITFIFLLISILDSHKYILRKCYFLKIREIHLI